MTNFELAKIYVANLFLSHETWSLDIKYPSGFVFIEQDRYTQRHTLCTCNLSQSDHYKKVSNKSSPPWLQKCLRIFTKKSCRVFF